MPKWGIQKHKEFLTMDQFEEMQHAMKDQGPSEELSFALGYAPYFVASARATGSTATACEGHDKTEKDPAHVHVVITTPNGITTGVTVVCPCVGFLDVINEHGATVASMKSLQAPVPIDDLMQDPQHPLNNVH
jgi:hypothetical protein